MYEFIRKLFARSDFFRRSPARKERSRGLDYAIAVAVAAAALLLRGALSPLLGGEHPFVLFLIAVIVVSWMCGFGPAMVTLTLGFLGKVYFFIEPNWSLLIDHLPHRAGVVLYLFSGVVCAVLGASERFYRLRAARALREALHQRDELEREIARRRQVEEQVRSRELELIRQTEALTASERRAAEALDLYRTLAEAMPQFVWMNRPDGYCEYFNQRWYDYTGLSAEECLGFRWSTPVHPEGRQRAEQLWKQATDTGEPYEVEYRIRRSDGQYRWFLGRAEPVRDASGAILHWFGTSTDIHDKKTLEDEVKRSLQRFRLLTEAIPQMVWTADASGVVDHFNHRWLQYTGIDVAAMGTPEAEGVVHPDDAANLAARWAEAVRDQPDHFTCEFRLRRRDGEYFWHLSSAVPLREHEGDAGETPSDSPRPGRVVQWVGTTTDIHDQKLQAEFLERLVAERTAELQRSNRDLEQFAAVASHDLQEPLRKIQAFGDRLSRNSRELLGPKGLEDLDRIQFAATRMRRLIDDLLTFSRVTTKAQPFTPIDLNVVLHGVLSDLEVRIAQTSAHIEEATLPTIDADPAQMRQLLQNLIANALKFHRPGVPPVVRIGIESAEDLPPGHVRLFVADNGIGFDERYLDRIFQVFQRLHGRHEYEGTGIGLAICKKIVERHGGLITARSQPELGAVFLIDLPVHHPQAEEKHP